eukprot:1621517-Pyramimonas_sp.AAC.1
MLGGHPRLTPPIAITPCLRPPSGIIADWSARSKEKKRSEERSTAQSHLAKDEQQPRGGGRRGSSAGIRQKAC